MAVVVTSLAIGVAAFGVESAAMRECRSDDAEHAEKGKAPKRVHVTSPRTSALMVGQI
jgi:hypothetical protein